MTELAPGYRTLTSEFVDRLIKRCQSLVKRGPFLIYMGPNGKPCLAPCPVDSCGDHLRQWMPERVILFMEQYDEPEHIVPQVRQSLGQYWELI